MYIIAYLYVHTHIRTSDVADKTSSGLYLVWPVLFVLFCFYFCFEIGLISLESLICISYGLNLDAHP